MKLEMEGLTAGYGGKRVLDGISLSVKKGEILTLIGPNGCGKSTLLKTVGRILRPQGGCVLLDGKSVHSMNTAELAKQMALLPQTHSAPEDLTVEQLVRYGRFPHRKVFCGLDSHDCEVVENVLGMTRLEGLRKRNLSTLSGGEMKRIEIATVLAKHHDLCVFDEPEAGIDLWSFSMLIKRFEQIHKEKKESLILISHQERIIQMADRIMVISDGKVQSIGDAKEIMPELFGAELDSCECRRQKGGELYGV